MSDSNKDYHQYDKFAELQQQWHGWGSPIGLTSFFVGLAFAFWIVSEAIKVLHAL